MNAFNNHAKRRSVSRNKKTGSILSINKKFQVTENHVEKFQKKLRANSSSRIVSQIETIRKSFSNNGNIRKECIEFNYNQRRKTTHYSIKRNKILKRRRTVK